MVSTSAGAGLLPEPTGPHRVGRTSAEVRDPGRPERYGPGAFELVLWIWYPADDRTEGETADYFPPAWTPNVQLLGLDVGAVRTHAVVGAPPSDGEPAYPVLLLSPSGFPPLLLAAFAEELASHGYIVVGVNHTYETAVTVFADGRVVPLNPAAIAGALGPQTGSHQQAFAERAAVCVYKALDLATVADQLATVEGVAGRLDLDRLGALGHSFGGDAALQWCRSDPRCLAAANLDGALWTEVGRTGLERPVLQVLAEHREFAVTGEQAVAAGAAPDISWFEAEKEITFGGWRTVQEHGHPGYTVRVDDATHLSFMDVPFLPATDTGNRDARRDNDQAGADVAAHVGPVGRLLRPPSQRPSRGTAGRPRTGPSRAALRRAGVIGPTARAASYRGGGTDQADLIRA
jgi:predicted dienelactone hydrolase